MVGAGLEYPSVSPSIGQEKNAVNRTLHIWDIVSGRTSAKPMAYTKYI